MKNFMNERHSRSVDFCRRRFCVGLEMNIKSKLTQFTSLINAPFHYQFMLPVIFNPSPFNPFLMDTIKSRPTFFTNCWMFFVLASCQAYECCLFHVDFTDVRYRSVLSVADGVKHKKILQAWEAMIHTKKKTFRYYIIRVWNDYVYLPARTC